DMAIGASGAWLYHQRERFSSFIENLPKAIIVSIYILLIAIFLFRDEVLLQNEVVKVFERAFIACVMLLVILEQCFSKHSFYKMSSLKTITKLGIYTYGLYCLHFMIISILQGVTKKFGLNTSLWQVLILEPALALTIT